MCQICKRSVDAGTEQKLNMAVLRVVQAESWGISVPEIKRSCIVDTKMMASGGEAPVYRATWKKEDNSVQEVAVKALSLPRNPKFKDLESLEQVVATTYLASRHSHHACKMMGVSWPEDYDVPSEVWCDLFYASPIVYVDGFLHPQLEAVFPAYFCSAEHNEN